MYTASKKTAQILVMKNIIVTVFFTIYFLLGLFIYKDFGVSWDEPIQRQYGLDTYNFVHYKNLRLEKK